MKQTDILAKLPFKFVEFRQNILATASNEILDTHASHNADLSQVTIWCQSNAYAHALRQAFATAAQEKKFSTVLLPNISTLQDWLYRCSPPERPLINEANKQLLLMEAIRQFPDLFSTTNAWQVTKELVGLFNECALAQVPLNTGADDINALLIQAYASPFVTLGNISSESEIIYQLWIAYSQQLESGNWQDPVQHYCDCLQQPFKGQANHSFYVVGIHRFTQLEANFLDAICNTHSLDIYYPTLLESQHALEYHPHRNSYAETKITTEHQDPRASVLAITYDRSAHTFDRIDMLKNRFKHNPYSSWLSVFTTNAVEKHVDAVCLQTKQWLLEGKFPIGIVSNDRLLTRRIRAVLEDSGVTADDLGGWALSTTSAATVIEILLDTIETNFRKEHLFDLLATPFLADNYSQSTYIGQVNRLRHLINSSRGVTRGGVGPYINLTESVHEEAPMDELLKVLQTIQAESKTLVSYSYQTEIQLTEFLKHLQILLSQLNIATRLSDDDAGRQILASLETSLRNIENNHIQLDWSECRQWVRDLLEHNYFAPTEVDQRVTLCGFDHLDFVRFASVIVAGVEQNRLHGSAASRTFFNEKVRKELGLQTYGESEAIKFIRFRQLLEQSENVLLCAESECRGETQEISPWVKMLELCSQQAFKLSLHNRALEYLLEEKSLCRTTPAEQAADASTRPSPEAPEDLIPTTISATQYQSMMDCPYQYFAKYILDLRREDLTDEFDASDFGRLVHQCLLEFHFDHAGKSKYSQTDFKPDAREQLVTALEQTSSDIFLHTSFPDAVKQGWLQRWLTNIPAYIDWAIERSRDWLPHRGETVINAAFSSEKTLQGQLDRLDSGNEGFALVDFKTGAIPFKKNVLQGETVQLPFYALLSEKIVQAEYLELGNPDGVQSKVLLDKQEVEELSHQHRARLMQLINELSEHTLLPALGAGRVCEICDYQGLCRKSHWNFPNLKNDNSD